MLVRSDVRSEMVLAHAAHVGSPVGVGADHGGADRVAHHFTQAPACLLDPLGRTATGPRALPTLPHDAEKAVGISATLSLWCSESVPRTF